MRAAGVPAELILATVRELSATDGEAKARQREANRVRQARKRENDKLLKNNDPVTVTPRDTALPSVTERDAPLSPLGPPSDGFPDPSLTPPFNPPSAPPPSSPEPIPASVIRSLITFTLPGWIDQGVWDAFMEVRKSKKAANTIRAKELLVKKLDRFRANGHDPTAVVEKSITSS